MGKRQEQSYKPEALTKEIEDKETMERLSSYERLEEIVALLV
jgi:hypothetical protein